MPGALAQHPPQRALFAAIGELEQLLLVPTEQRRDQQIGKVEVIERLHREGDGGEEIADRERFGQMQPVDTRDLHLCGKQPRDDQRGELAAAADQDQDIPRAQGPFGRSQDRRLVEPALDLAGEPIRVEPVAVVEPALLPFVGVVGGLDRKWLP